VQKVEIPKDALRKNTNDDYKQILSKLERQIVLPKKRPMNYESAGHVHICIELNENVKDSSFLIFGKISEQNFREAIKQRHNFEKPIQKLFVVNRNQIEGKQKVDKSLMENAEIVGSELNG
jgi:hypothetical protein